MTDLMLLAQLSSEELEARLISDYWISPEVIHELKVVFEEPELHLGHLRQVLTAEQLKEVNDQVSAEISLGESALEKTQTFRGLQDDQGQTSEQTIDHRPTYLFDAQLRDQLESFKATPVVSQPTLFESERDKLDACTLDQLSTLAYETQSVVLETMDQRAARIEPNDLEGSTLSGDLLDDHQRYARISELGEGGMSTVWLTSDLHLGRQVALKEFKLNSSLSQSHFELEARVMSQLDHPGILPVYDVIRDSQNEGVRGYTMRVASCQTLMEKITNAPYMDLHELCQIVRQIALTLEYAHQRGVVHRDIKPHNILLGEHGEVYLSDWGICLLLPHHTDYQPLSDEMRYGLVGSPSYMSPEQAKRDSELQGVSIDIYGLGATLYHALAGHPPAFGNSIIEVISSVLNQPNKPHPRAVRAKLGESYHYPDELTAICMRAIAFHPEDRYQSARDFARAIERFIKGEERRAQQEREAEAYLKTGYQQKLLFEGLFGQRRELLDEIAALGKTYRKIYKELTSTSLRQQMVRCDAQLAELLTPLEESFAKAVSSFESALQRSNHYEVEAKQQLWELYKLRYREARRERDLSWEIFFEKQLRKYGSSQQLKMFDDLSEVKLLNLPAHTNITLYDHKLLRYPRESEIVLRDQLPLDQPITLPRGRYRLLIQHDEGGDVCIPLELSTPQSLELPCPIPRRESLFGHFAYIRGKLAISTYPVTMRQYFEFLNALSPETADQHIPRYQQINYIERDAQGRFSLPYTDREGDVWEAEQPVLLVSQRDAVAYTEWLSAQYQRVVRLPSAEEWLYAARGDDNRPYPWGSDFDPSLCSMRDSQRGRAKPTPVGAYPHDRSPFGVYDIAGTICQWTSSTIDSPDHYRVMGASFNSMDLLSRLDQEIRAHEDATGIHIGFRVALELTDEDFL